MQNVDNQGKSQKTISVSFHYNVLFRNGWDASQFQTMAYQICPSNWPWLVNAFNDATSKPYGHLVINHQPLKPKKKTVATNILPSKQFT